MGLSFRLCIQRPDKRHSRSLQQLFHLWQRVPSLVMRLRKLPEKSRFFLHKDRQIILVALFLFVIKIFPNKTAFLSVLRNDRLPDDLLILIDRIKIKDKNALGI